VQRLADTVAVVSGATRGAGKGIALVLGGEGATVYVTGRTSRAGGEAPLGSVEETAEAVSARGGVGVPVRCDHRSAEEIAALVETVRGDHGRIDVLVNNAWAGYEVGVRYEPFWELPLEHWELMVEGGLKTQFLTTRLALPLITRDRGLVVNTTWAVDERLHRHLVYDTVKNAVSRMTRGMAEDLRLHRIAVTAVSPGWMHTERMSLTPEQAARTESTEYVGRGVAALAADEERMRWTGETVRVIDLARHYGFTDVDGKVLSGFWEQHLADRGEPA
jgi:NAD(P)-dependent dehydrogenase (short-subunit alcohol dehydrogenase family)